MSAPNHYQPGQAVRILLAATSLGGPISPTTVTAYVKDTAGTITTYASPTMDSAGNYHQDFALPNNAVTGTWLVKWVTSGALVDYAGTVFSSFVVDPLWF